MSPVEKKSFREKTHKPNYTINPVVILLYKSKQDYSNWVVQHLPESKPREINSEFIDEYRFEEICKEYLLYNTEKAKGVCPFCRVNKSEDSDIVGSIGMRVLSNKYREGTLEGGGVIMIPCICKQFKE